MGCHSFLQGIFLTQGLNPGLLHHRQLLYCPSYSSLRCRWDVTSVRETSSHSNKHLSDPCLCLATSWTACLGRWAPLPVASADIPPLLLLWMKCHALSLDEFILFSTGLYPHLTTEPQQFSSLIYLYIFTFYLVIPHSKPTVIFIQLSKNLC